MKLTDKERLAVSMLRALDAQQRNKLLSDIRRAALANQAIMKAGRKAGALKKISPVANHRIVKAFGTLPNWRPRLPPDSD